MISEDMRLALNHIDTGDAGEPIPLEHMPCPRCGATSTEECRGSC